MSIHTDPIPKTINTRTKTESFGIVEFTKYGDNGNLRFGNQAEGLARVAVLYTDRRVNSKEDTHRIRELSATFPEYSRESEGFVSDPTSAYQVEWRDTQRVGETDPKPYLPHRATFIRVVRLSQVLGEDGQPAISEEVVAHTLQGYLALGATDEVRALAMASANEAIFNAVLMLEDVNYQFREGTRSFSDLDQIDGWKRPPNDATLLAAAMARNTNTIYQSRLSPDRKEIMYGEMI